MATQFKIGESTVHDILKRKNEYLNENPNHHLAERKRDRTPPKFEEALAIWCDAIIEANLPLSGHLLQSKALHFAALLGISTDEFKCSNGWVSNFKNRYNIREYTRCGEANRAPLERLPTYRTEYPSLSLKTCLTLMKRPSIGSFYHLRHSPLIQFLVLKRWKIG